MNKRVRISIVLLLLSASLLALSIARISEARGSVLRVSPNDEVVEKIQLSPPDSIVGNVTVNDGFIDFYITSPSYLIIFESNKTAFQAFNITANETGTYVMHFHNKYQLDDVNVILNYGVNLFIVTSVSISTSVSTTVTITHVQQSFLQLVISPQGFPVPGQFWQIDVFRKIEASNSSYYTYLPNATVQIIAKTNNRTDIGNYTTDVFGRTQFENKPEYTDISFQAFYEGNESDTIRIGNNHYVPTQYVDFSFALSGVMSGISLAATVIVNLKAKAKLVFSILFAITFAIYAGELLISVVAKSFWWTPSGYSEVIWGVLTWTIFKYISILGILLFLGFAFLAILVKFRKTEAQSTNR